MGGILYRKNSKPMGEKFTGGVAVNLKPTKLGSLVQQLIEALEEGERSWRQLTQPPDVLLPIGCASRWLSVQ
jgi:hypothetical protein